MSTTVQTSAGTVTLTDPMIRALTYAARNHTLTGVHAGTTRALTRRGLVTHTSSGHTLTEDGAHVAARLTQDVWQDRLTAAVTGWHPDEAVGMAEEDPTTTHEILTEEWAALVNLVGARDSALAADMTEIGARLETLDLTATTAPAGLMDALANAVTRFEAQTIQD